MSIETTSRNNKVMSNSNMMTPRDRYLSEANNSTRNRREQPDVEIENDDVVNNVIG